MNFWKTFVIIGVAAVCLWFLAPRRSHESAKDANVVEITYMGQGAHLANIFSDMFTAFERRSLEAHQKDPSKPIYKLILSQQGTSDVDMTADPTRFMISVAGDMPPDVIFFDRFALGEWAIRGAFTPLDKYIERDLAAGHPDAVEPEGFYDAAWEECLYNGQPYGIPHDLDDRALYYNKDMFRRAGIVDAEGNPTPPRSWDELRDYAKRLTQYDENGNLKVLGFSPLFGNAWLYMYSWMNGGEFMSPDGKTCTLDDPLNVEALTFMVDIFNDAGGYNKVKAFESGFMSSALDPFITGKIAMRIDGSGFLRGMVQFTRDLDFAVAPPPVSARLLAQGQTTTSWSGGWAYAIPYNARNKDAGWEFIRFMVGDEGWPLYCEAERDAAESQGYPYIPPIIPIIEVNERTNRKYVRDNPAMPQTIKDAHRVFMDLLPISHFRPVTPVGQVLWHRHDIATQEACYEKKTPKQALADNRAIVQRELDRLTQPPQGRPINWTLFFVAYGLLIVLLAGGAYYWDTHRVFRRRLGALGSRAIFRRPSVEIGGTLEGSEGSYFRAQWRWGWLFVAPWLIGFIVFGAGPMLYSILMSFCDYDVINPASWIGLENYRRMFTDDELVPKSLYNTVFMALAVPIGMTVSLAMALLLNMRVRGVALWRTMFYLPAIVPFVASFMLWTWVFNPVGGVLNQILSLVGIQGPNWLQSEQWSKPSLIIMGVWGAGAQMLIWLAGLKGISQHYYEAAAIDGANRLKQFRYVTLPMLTPYIFFNLIMGFIGVFQIFESAYIMTKGGPVNSTLFYVYHLFNNAFRYGHMGYACAMAWFLFVIIMVLTAVQLRLSNRWVNYDTD